MKIWLLNEGENLPGDDNNPRLQRMGLLAYELSKFDVSIIWWQSSFNHNIKKFRCYKDKEIALTENMRLKLLHSCGYKKNVCLKRMRHELITAKKFMKKAQNESLPDVIVVAMPTIASAYYAVRYGKKHGVPVIVDVRDLQPDVYIRPFNGIRRCFVKLGIIPLKCALSFAIKEAVGIVGTTEPYLKWALKYAKRARGKNDRVYFVCYPDGGTKNSIEKNSKWIRYRREDTLVCCFFGQFGRLVDFDTMLLAAEKCVENNLKVIFLLCGQGELLEYYKKRAEEKKLDNVVFPGWVNKSDIADIGYISDVGLMAYKKDDNFEMQMPNKFSEYLSLGLAILLQPTGIMKRVIEENGCGIQYDDAEGLYLALTKLKKEKELLCKMKNNSRALFEKSFSVEKVYKEYSEYIIYIAKGNKR